jgi:gliding motility-associated-like protein
VKYRFLALACCLLLLSGAGSATHIIGGELTYNDLGGNDYAITMKLYRDCGPANSNGTGFDPTITVGFFNANGVLQTSLSISNLVVTPVPISNSNPCLTPPPVCVEEGLYTGQINLPPIPGGYTLSYQRCCRNPTILNLAAPNTQGITTLASIPDVAVAASNGSPSFIDFPPIAICANDSLLFDHSAMDPDGDVLVYSLCDPLMGASQANPAPGIPAPPPYTGVTWGAGFSAAAPFTAGSSLSIDASTGLLIAAPMAVGQYVVGVCVQEFRNGQLLSETKRDFQFNVVPCVLLTTSSVQQQQQLCTGLTVDFVNQSTGANDYFWDFGVPGTLADTSSAMNPTFVFPDTGSYNVMLIANPTWPCSDTSLVTFDIRLPLDPVITVPPVQCFNDQDLWAVVDGEFTEHANVSWDMGPLAVDQFLSGDSVSTLYLQPSDYPISVEVSQYGCTETVFDTLLLVADPIADFSWDPSGCVPFEPSLVNLSTASTGMTFLWTFGDGDSSTLTVPPHVYTDPGLYDLTLTVVTDSGCVDTVTKTVLNAVLVQDVPDAGFMVDPLQVSILDGTINVTDASTDGTGWMYTLNGEVFSTPDFSYQFDGGGSFTIVQTVTNDVGCSDTAMASVTVLDHLFYAPNSFTPNGDGINDEWIPTALGVVSYDLSIFDRWGDLVFSTQDLAMPWAGIDEQVGTYSYLVRLKSAGGFPSLYQGSVTLVR